MCPAKSNVSIINGPNINMLGKRESIYGSFTLDELKLVLSQKATDRAELFFYQSNHEGELIELIQKMNTDAHGVIINPAAFTHTSIGIRDALACLDIPKIEVHISNIYQRESFRQVSYSASQCDGVITGLGIHSYTLALDYIIEKVCEPLN